MQINTISIMKSTMMDILKDFQGSNLQKTDLNQTLDDLSGKPSRKGRSAGNQFPFTRQNYYLSR